MRVSFKVSKKGSRFRPKTKPECPPVLEDNDEVDAPSQLLEIQPAATRKRSVDVTEADEDAADIIDAEVSFIVNIFPDGYSIRNPSKGNNGHHNTAQDDAKFLRPYDRTSESLFAAIECGRLPSNFLDDIPCKYSNGAVVCEVRDYRKDTSEPGVNGPSITKVSLKMSLDNVVKDITQISDDDWTYGDLMEAEAKILKALKPTLCLNPTPNLNRLWKEPTSLKLNLDIPGIRRKRLRQMSEAATNSVPENSRPLKHHPDTQNVGQINMMATQRVNHVPDLSVSHQLKDQISVGNPRRMQGHALSTQGASSSTAGMISSIMSSVYGKRGNQDGHLSSMFNVNKRGRLNSINVYGNQQHMDSINAPESRWNPNVGMQKHPQQMFDGSFRQETRAMSLTKGQQGIRYNLIQEPQQFTRSNFTQAQWNNMGQPLENNTRKEEHLKRRTPAQSQIPRISSVGGLPQSPREFSRGSMGMQFGAVPAAAAQREKTVVTSMQQQHQAQMATNRSSNSVPNISILSGVGSPSSVDFLSASSSDGEETDESLRDRFSKIEMVTARFQLNCKGNKIDEYKRTTRFPTQQLTHCLFNDYNNESLKDETCKMRLSKSLVGGNMNVCKTRVLKFEGNESSLFPKEQTKLTLSEKPSDGTVTMHYRNLNDCDGLPEEEHLPTLPNTHTADLLAAQFCSLMVREGYRLESDDLQPKPIETVQSPGGEIQQIPELVSINEVAKPSKVLSSSRNMPSARMQPRGNSNSVSLSQGVLLPGVSMASIRPRQSEPQPSVYHPHQQQQQRVQRSSAMMLTSHLNGAAQNSATSAVQLQLLHEQQQSRMQQRKMMTSMGQTPVSINQGSSVSNSMNQQLRAGQLTPALTAAMIATRVRLAQSYIPGGSQGANRQNQRNVVANLMSGMNQQQLLQSRRSLPQQVGSPSPSFGMPHQQQASSQPIPVSPQISSGAIHPPNREGTVPASPQG